MRALVIDDSAAVRGILCRMLRELDFQISEAANGQEGLERLGEIGVPDIATVNWQMPVMDGLQFIRAVRADTRFRDIPVLMISTESEPAKVAVALAAGVNEYIVKPCTRHAISEKLNRLGISCCETSGANTATQNENIAPKGWRKKRILVVDDSTVVRRVMSKVISEDPDLEVAGTAADGKIALEKLEQLKPDLVLLDVEMPNMDGLMTLRVLRERYPRLPVVMFSSLTQRGAAVTTDALLLGANDFVPKPGGTQMKDVVAGKQAIRDEVIPKIKQLAACKSPIGLAAEVKRSCGRAPRKSSKVDVVALALSTGGPAALAQILPKFAVECPVPILVVQHMPPVFTKRLAERLADNGKLDVCEGVDGEMLSAGKIRIAPGGYHMTTVRKGDEVHVHLHQEPPVNSCRPSADVLFRSVAQAYGSAGLAVVLTGMGQDGLRGCKLLNEARAQIVVQDEATSVVWGMPGHVARAGLAEQVLPLNELGAEILRRIRGAPGPESPREIT